MEFNNIKSAVFRRINYQPIALSRYHNTVSNCKSAKKDTLLFSDQDSNKATNSEISHIGSTMPKSTRSKFQTQKIIKPLAEIVAEPIIKAALQIEKQSASIPWDEIDSTLQLSKKNIQRVKEIHMPDRETRPSSSLKPSQTKLDNYLFSHRNSIQEEVKNIFSGQNADGKSFAVQTDERFIKDEGKTLINFIYKSRPSTAVKHDTEDISKSLLIKKYDNKSSKVLSARKMILDKKMVFTPTQTEKALGTSVETGTNPSRIKVKIKSRNRMYYLNTAANYSASTTQQGSDMLNTHKGNTRSGNLKNKRGITFTPMSYKSLTPSRLLSFNF